MKKRQSILMLGGIGCIGCCAIPFLLPLFAGGSLAMVVTSKGIMEVSIITVGIVVVAAFVIYIRSKRACARCRVHGCSCDSCVHDQV